jgi:RNA polymerase sigma-70 factor (ECF subfamily)
MTLTPTTATEQTKPAGFNFQRDIVSLIPFLRAFAGSLCRHRDEADDLAQEALTKAWRSRDKFEPGTNLKAWLFTILRNEFYSGRRRAWREARLDQGVVERIAAPPNAQGWTVDLCDTAHALHGLPNQQREALILIGAAGFSFQEAAEICGTPVGTIKSRVSRGRAALADALDGAKPIARIASVRRAGGFDDILAQLTALVPSEAKIAAGV